MVVRGKIKLSPPQMRMLIEMLPFGVGFPHIADGGEFGRNSSPLALTAQLNEAPAPS
jgi:hypothetical protein